MIIKYIPEDKWVGLFHKREIFMLTMQITYREVIYQNKYFLCIIPCLPIIWKGKKFTVKEKYES